ncbi:exodeoxyribonuclease X C-terminal domain-containing protein [Gelidibacter gilvus]|uniref:Exodeoxyribonuclease X-like C-terminal domain-containing protein n=1 Tax=Gelidibacter gilvus TaxID=59602 RepID=A0A4Q0XHP9_9FLAO|nr:hypothetical protein [Gelidibacter gilvus]RXJ51098.1 hypothetical protein ESZ48_04265 [Gelidibacter gilvus]
MDLYDLDTVFKNGQHKGKSVAEVLIQNNSYLHWCYGNRANFFITDAVWEALDDHKDIEVAFTENFINAEDFQLVVASNKKYHQEKRDNYKKYMMDIYEREVESCLQGDSQIPY